MRATTTMPGRPAALERRTWGALAFGVACLAAMVLSVFAVMPLSGPFFIVVLCLYGVICGTVMTKITAFHPYAHFGLPNVATLLRGTIACFFLGLAVGIRTLSNLPGAELAWWLLALAVTAGVLDAADGWMARRQSLSSRFGARFDMEMDALLILALAALLTALDKAGFWLLALGLVRYLFVIAGTLYTPLERPLPDSLRRKTVCVVQVVALTVMLMPPVEGIWATALGLVALVTLLWSFGLDVIWLVRHRGEPS